MQSKWNVLLLKWVWNLSNDLIAELRTIWAHRSQMFLAHDFQWRANWANWLFQVFSSEIFLLDKKFSVSQKLDLSFVETQTTSLWNLKMSQIVLRFAICNQKSEFSVVSCGKQWNWSLLNKDIVMVHNLNYVSIFLKCVKTHKQLF